MQKASTLILTTALGLLALSAAPLGASPVPLTNVQLDVDGDGRADSVTVSIDGRVAVRRADGIPEALSFTPLTPLSAAFVEIWSGKAGARFLRIEGRTTSGGRLLMLSALRGGRLSEIHNGPIGPIGRDAEYSVEVKLVNGELLRYQTAPAVRRCDGETRLFLERYSETAGFVAAPELTLPAAEARVLSTANAGPADLKAPPLGIYRYVAASLQAGIVRADMLTPPRELFDGNRGTAWRVAGDPRGAFVTAQSDGSGHSVRALRIESAAANQGALPQKLLLFFDDKPPLRVDLSPAAPGGVQWLVLPEPIACRCLSVAVLAGAGKPPTALAELSIYSELDGNAGTKALVDRVARGSSTDAATAARTLQELSQKSPPIGPELVEAAAAILGTPDVSTESRRRLEELLLAVAESPSLAEAPRARVGELILAGLQKLSQADRTTRLSSLRRAGKFGEGVLSRLVLDDKLLPEQRAEALALLRCLPDGHPTLSQVQSAIASSLPAAGTPVADAAPLKVAAALVNALTAAQAGCPDAAARARLVEDLVALWPRLPADGASSPTATAQFVVRYRLLQGLERLASATPSAAALLTKIAESEPEPVLRQTAARALVALKQGTPGIGLADRDAGVRLATLAALQSAMQGPEGAALLPAVEERLSSDGWPQVRRVAAEVRAAACPPKPAQPAPQVASLRKALADSDGEVQKLALIGVTRCEGAGALDVLIRVAEGKDARSRESAASLRGLGCALVARHGLSAPGLDAAMRSRAHKAAQTALLDLFQDPSADERSAAALSQCMRGLGDAGDGSDLPGLVDVAASDIPAPLRTVALRSITAICGRGPVPPGAKKGLPALWKAAQGDADGKLQAEARRAQAMCK